MAAIKFFEEIPEVRIDATGVSGISCSGDEATHWRCDRSTYRRFLETRLRQLNEFEAEERRLARGKVLPFKAAAPGH